MQKRMTQQLVFCINYQNQDPCICTIDLQKFPLFKTVGGVICTKKYSFDSPRPARPPDCHIQQFSNWIFSSEKPVKKQKSVIFFERVLKVSALSNTHSAALECVNNEHVGRSYRVHAVYITL